MELSRLVGVYNGDTGEFYTYIFDYHYLLSYNVGWDGSYNGYFSAGHYDIKNSDADDYPYNDAVSLSNTVASRSESSNNYKYNVEIICGIY